MRARVWMPMSLVLGLALLIRMLPLTYSHVWDETVFLQDAKVILDGHDTYDEFFERPPLLSIVYALGFALWDNVYVANLLQGICSALAVLFAFLYARGTFGTLAGVCAAFVLAFGPYFVDISHQLMTDMPAVTLMLAAMWLFDKPRARFAVLAGVMYALAVEMRFTSLFLAAYFALEVAFNFSVEKLKRSLLFAAAAAATLAPYLIWLKARYGSFLEPFVRAERIVQEWTAPVPVSLYFDGIRGVFPPSLWIALALGLAGLAWRWVQVLRGSAATSSSAEPTVDRETRRLTSLLIWGIAFFAYMCSIPHKEVRYLLPLAIPVVIIGSAAIARVVSSLAGRPQAMRVAATVLGLVWALVDYGRPLQRLDGPLTDGSESADVQIARYLREHSAPTDTIYAAHNFPVLAFYTQRPTVSVLPIQQRFEPEWRQLMSAPGYFVYFEPEQIGEIHAVDTRLQPDRQFLAAHAEFAEVRSFPTATVYRYTPRCCAVPVELDVARGQ